MKTPWDNDGYGFDPYEQDREDNAVGEILAEIEDADGEEMMENLYKISEAAKQCNVGDISFMAALHEGGLFRKRPN